MLQVVGSQIQVHGHMSFVGNNAESHEGGALHIQAFGQVKVYPGSNIEFINNTGRLAMVHYHPFNWARYLFLSLSHSLSLPLFSLSLHSLSPFCPATRIGAAIVVDVQRSSIVHSELIYNPNCFLIHNNSTLAPDDWNDVSSLSILSSSYESTPLCMQQSMLWVMLLLIQN